MATKNNCLDSFNNLRLNSEKKQVHASISIINHIIGKQNVIGYGNSRELHLCTKRIVRGLAANTSASRNGYFTAYTALLDALKESVVLDEIFKICEQEFQAQTQKEEVEVNRGYILAYLGIVFTDRILECTDEQLENMIKKLVNIYGSKKVFEISVNMVLVEVCKKVNEEQLINVVWPVLNQNIFESGNKLSLELYYLLFKINGRCPLAVNEDILSKLIGSSDFKNENFVSKTLIPELLVVSDLKCVNAEYYKDMLKIIYKKKKFVKLFWKELDKLLESANNFEIDLSLVLFKHFALKMYKKDWIAFLFEPNFVTVLCSFFQGTASTKLHHEVLEALFNITKDKNSISPETQFIIFERLVFNPGNFRFAFGAGQKLIYSLLSTFNQENVFHFANVFVEVIKSKSVKVIHQGNKQITKPWKESHKKHAIIALTRLLINPAVDASSWKKGLMKEIIQLAFFTQNYSLAITCRKAFYKVIDHKTINPKYQQRLIYNAIKFIDKKLFEDDYSGIDKSRKFMAVWRKLVDKIKEIINLEETNKLTKTVFFSMFLLAAIMLIREPVTAFPIVDELLTAYDKMIEFVSSKNNEGTNKNINEENTEEIHWTDVMTDIMLSMLSSDSNLQRTLISKSFVYLCPFLRSQNINHILKVFNPQEEVMTNPENDNESVDDEDEDIGNDADSSKSSSDDEKSEDELEIEEADNLDDKELEVLRSNVQDAFKVINNFDPISLDDMSEDEGNKLDAALVEAFKKSKQFSQKAENYKKKQLNTFRIRALDLLEIYLKTNPEINNVFDIMVAILMLLENLINTGTDIELQTRLRLFLSKLTSTKQFSFNTKINLQQLVDLLQKLINKDERTYTVYMDMKNELIKCSHFILKLSLRDNKRLRKLEPLIFEVYRDSLKNLYTKRNKVKFELFKNAFSFDWNRNLTLCEDIVSNIADKKLNSFYLEQSLQLIATIFNNGRLISREKEISDSKLLSIISKLIAVKDMFQNLSEKLQKEYIGIISNIKKLEIANDLIANVNLDSLNKNFAKTISAKDVSNEDTPKNGLNNVNESKKDKMKSLKRKNVNIKNIKKQNKIRRVENSSEGLEGGIFTNDLIYNNDFIDGKITSVENDE